MYGWRDAREPVPNSRRKPDSLYPLPRTRRGSGEIRGRVGGDGALARGLACNGDSHLFGSSR